MKWLIVWGSIGLATYLFALIYSIVKKQETKVSNLFLVLPYVITGPIIITIIVLAELDEKYHLGNLISSIWNKRIL